jgi:DNA repair protein RadC
MDVKFKRMKNINKPSTSIKNWAMDDRPREKLLIKGPVTLSDSELLAILINNGNKEKSAVDLAKEILKMANNNLNELGKFSVQEYQRIKGIGLAKAITIAAAIELGRRRQLAPFLKKTVFRKSEDIAQFIRTSIKDYTYEVFGVVYLNRSNRVNHFEIISSGGISGTVVDTRIILKKAIEHGATSIVLCHNHPSGNLKPSKSDEELTKKIKEASKYHDIEVIDHIIVSEEGYFSFSDDGLL